MANHLKMEFTSGTNWVEVTAWRYAVTYQLQPHATDRTGWACDLCEDDRGAVHRASVGFLDLRFYRKADFLPTTRMYHTLLARYMRFEDKKMAMLTKATEKVRSRRERVPRPTAVQLIL